MKTRIPETWRKATLICLAILSAGITVTMALGATGNPSTSAKVDALFAAWNARETPEYAVGVAKDRVLLYSNAWGMADVEHQVPNTPTTMFDVASISKQFTAFANHLLAQDGRTFS